MMPIYSYQCSDCGYEHEEIQKFSDPPLEVCPECGGRLEKQMSAPSLHFKGKGWASDGYSSSSNEKSKVLKKTKEALTGKPD